MLNLVSPKGKRIITIDELKELHNIWEEYELIKLTANKRDVAMNKKDGSTEIVELHQIKADFRPKHILLTKSYQDIIREVFTSATPTVSWSKYSEWEKLWLIPHFDLHIDRYEHKNKKYLEEIDSRTNFLFEKMIKEWISKVLYIQGWDFYNSCSAKGWISSTTSWTPQFNYLTENESFQVWLQHQKNLISNLASELPTDVIYLPWNHWRHKEQYLADAIELYFSKTDNVNVDNKDIDRKYYKWWTNTIGMAHWDWLKQKLIPQIMPNETKLSKHNYFLSWHVHQRTINDLWTVLSEVFPSPAHPWAWENRNWWNTRGKLYGQVYDKKEGKVAEFIK